MAENVSKHLIILINNKTIKNFKHYALLLFVSVAVFSCSKDYDDTELRSDVNDLKSRVEKLETWCNTANSQINALQGLVTALEAKDYVTGVSPISEGEKEVGYTIMFSKSGAVTIYNGKDGVKGADGISPVIGVAKDTDGFYYWTIKMGDADATWMKDADGNKIRTMGEKGADGVDGEDGQTPVLSVATDADGKVYWKINGEWLLNNGQKVQATGDKGDTGVSGAQGDAVFASNGVKVFDDYVEFTLAGKDGVTFTLPKTNGITIGFDSYTVFYCSPTDNQITLELPTTLKESDYNAITATVSNGKGFDMDIQTRSASTADSWGVKVIKPVFSDGNLVKGSAKVLLTLPQNKTNYQAVLRVTIIDNKGKESSVSRIVWFKADNDANVIDNNTGTLSDKIANPATVKQLSVIGAISNDDFRYIRENLTSIEVLDLSRATITTLPERAMAFYDTMGLTDNTSLKTVILPESLTTIGNSVFAMCTGLTEINIPANVRILGRWMFEGCNQLTEVTLPDGITDIPASAFYSCGIESINIPSSVNTVGAWAFNLCNNLISITIPASVTSLGESVLRECANLRSADIQANVNTLSRNFFLDSKRLTNVKLATSITTLESNSFGNTGLTEFTIPTHIRTVGEGAFSYNVNLETVSIPNGLQMSFSLFNSCTKLKNVTIAEGVTEIGAETFRDCIALKGIILPSTIASIRDRAFQGCSALTSVTCKATTIPELSSHNTGENYNLHFYGIHSSCVLKRPAGVDYSSWSTYFKGGVQDL